VSRAAGGVATIWDVGTGKEIAILREHGQHGIEAAVFGPDESHIMTKYLSQVRIWNVQFATMPTRALIIEVSNRLSGVSKLSREEMRLIGYLDNVPEIDVGLEM
jgi:hypothetical protein